MSSVNGLQREATFSSGRGRTNIGGNSTRSCVRWTRVEDTALVTSLVDLVNVGGWKLANGQFKLGYQLGLERLMKEKLSNCQKRAHPHIESRLRALRRQYSALAEMRDRRSSGFGWNDYNNCITCDDEVWENWVKSHPTAAGLRDKPFHLYDKLDYVFGKNNAIGAVAENQVDEIKNTNVHEQEHHSQHEASPFFESQNIEQEENSHETPTNTQSAHTPQATDSNARRKKKRNEMLDVSQDLTIHLSNATEIIGAVRKHICMHANCFKHEAEGANRRMNVVTELMKLSGLSQEQIIKVGRKIALDQLETDYFFSLPEDFRLVYVEGLLHH